MEADRQDFTLSMVMPYTAVTSAGRDMGHLSCICHSRSRASHPERRDSSIWYCTSLSR